jgi:hypothetical protein
MNATTSAITIPPATFAELCDYLRMSGSTLSATDAIISAVKQWIAAESEPATPERGYQWKRVFLPDGTRVRMQSDGEWSYADVIGDELMYRGRTVSPRQLTIAIAGNGRNAWRDLWIRRPGEKGWSGADRLRRAHERIAEVNPPSPIEAMQAAAHSMSHALQTALALVDHVRHEAEQATDRRIARHRRRDDYMVEDCKAD